MKICAISDIHGNLNFAIKKCDLLIIAGDICPAFRDPNRSAISQEEFLNNKFMKWISAQPFKECVFIAGNHDWIFDINKYSVPKFPDNIHYLCDSSIELFGLKIYGTPQQPIFLDWAFNRTEEQLYSYFDNIPNNLDILVTHTAPYGILDKVQNLYSPERKSYGCKVLRKKIDEVKPKFSVFGHFHGNYGKTEENGTTFINCSLLDESYDLVKNPIYFEI